MVTIFHENFRNSSQWVSGNGLSSSLVLTNDPLGQKGFVGTFNSLESRPSTFSKVLINPIKSWSISFDYLGLAANDVVSIYLGGIIGVADGASLSDFSIAYAGSIKPSYLPMNDICIVDYPPGRIPGSYGYDQCENRKYIKYNTFTFLEDNGKWNHYSFSFSTASSNIRLTISDFRSANYPENGIAGDCYLANLLVTDNNGPSDFIATSSSENFKSISVNALNKVANSVSYINSQVGVRVNLAINRGYYGDAEGDTYSGIKTIIGSKYSDTLIGDSQDNVLNGGEGDDILEAGLGNDILIGGMGKDKFSITTLISSATIEDFNITTDRIDLRLFPQFSSFADLQNLATYSEGTTIIGLNSSRFLSIQNINIANMNQNNFCFKNMVACGLSQPTTQSFVIGYQCTEGSNKNTIIPFANYVNDADEVKTGLKVQLKSLPYYGILKDLNFNLATLNDFYNLGSLQYTINNCNPNNNEDSFGYVVFDSDGFESNVNLVSLSGNILPAVPENHILCSPQEKCVPQNQSFYDSTNTGLYTLISEKKVPLSYISCNKASRECSESTFSIYNVENEKKVGINSLVCPSTSNQCINETFLTNIMNNVIHSCNDAQRLDISNEILVLTGTVLLLNLAQDLFFGA